MKKVTLITIALTATILAGGDMINFQPITKFELEDVSISKDVNITIPKVIVVTKLTDDDLKEIKNQKCDLVRNSSEMVEIIDVKNKLFCLKSWKYFNKQLTKLDELTKTGEIPKQSNKPFECK